MHSSIPLPTLLRELRYLLYLAPREKPVEGEDDEPVNRHRQGHIVKKVAVYELDCLQA